MVQPFIHPSRVPFHLIFPLVTWSYVRSDNSALFERKRGRGDYEEEEAREASRLTAILITQS